MKLATVEELELDPELEELLELLLLEFEETEELDDCDDGCANVELELIELLLDCELLDELDEFED